MSRQSLSGHPRISVVIPTRNRLEYLPFAIETVLSQDDRDFELIVSNNHSQDGTADFLGRLHDPRLRVIVPDRPLAMVDHFEWVLDQVTGEWVTILGDDDGLMPYFFSFTNPLLNAVEKHFDVVFGARSCYTWRGLEDLYGQTSVEFGATASANQLDCRKSLKDLAQGLGSYFEYPQFYTGTVFRRSLIGRIRSATSTGRVFNSVSPDAASVAAILLGDFPVLQMGIPLAWVGSSPKSNGAQSAQHSRGSRAGLTTFADYSALNVSSTVRICDRFQATFEIGTSAQLFFLEALHATLITQRSPQIDWFGRMLSRHILFVELYRAYRKGARRGETSKSLERLFRDNGCHLFLLAVLLWLAPFRRIRRSLGRRIDELLGYRPRRKLPRLSFRADASEGLDTIIKANDRLNQDPLRRELGGFLKLVHKQVSKVVGRRSLFAKD